MFKKLLKKVIHSVEHSQHKHSSSKRGRQGYARHSSSDKKTQVYRHSSSDRPRSRGGSSSDYRHGSGHKGHKYYKNRYGSHSS
ncbi:hypothetical protein NST99_12870 [Paenibacillus sp. FSL L8-0470]|uniref:hypothetical protein n=1 Tax=unclassified Paenibacillus TaxID=185978 RepID=UPI0030F91269